MLLKSSNLRVLFLGNREPGNDSILQWLEDGLRCPVFFDWTLYLSDLDLWKVYNKYDFILVDFSETRFHNPDFNRRVLSSGLPVLYLLENPETEASLALIDEGAEGCVSKGDPAQLVASVYKMLKSRIVPDRTNNGCISGDKEKLAQEILDNLEDAFYIVDRDWCFTYINHKAELCWGHNRENMLGKNSWDNFPFARNLPDKEMLYAAMEQRVPMQWETPSLDKEFWLDVRTYPVSDGGLSVLLRNITEKKHAEEVLRVSRDRQSIMLRLSDSLHHLDSPGDIHEAAAHIIGEYLGVERAFYCDVVTVGGVDYFSLEKFYAGRDATMITGLHPIDSPGVLASENFEGRNIVVCDMESDPRIGDAIRPSLRAHRLGAWISVPLIRNGKFVASFTVHQQAPRNWTQEEISLIEETTARTWAEADRVRAKAALEKSEQHARQLVRELENDDRNKNDFINALSHELRNPLASIVACLSMLDLLDQNPHIRKPKEIIKRQTDQLCHLVDDLLDLTRITNNKIKLRLELLDLNALAQTASYDHRTLFEEKGIELITDIGETPLYINADPVRIAQAIGNLLHNACKFTDKGGKTVLSVGRRADKAVIVVSDSGIGIEQSFLPDLFKTFKQADPNKGGLGLGLSIVKGIIELHGGTVDAESNGVARGATFTITLPLPATPSAKEAHEMSENDEFCVKPLKILLIDDNRDLADITCSLLALYGYDAEFAHSGISGIEKAVSFLPNVIICDIGLPDIDGYEVARRISGCRELEKVCLISLSGYAQAGDYDASKEAGFNMHITKPVDFANLRAILHSIGQQ